MPLAMWLLPGSAVDWQGEQQQKGVPEGPQDDSLATEQGRQEGEQVVTAKIDEQYLGRDECETWDGFGFGMNKAGIGSRLPLPWIEPKADFQTLCELEERQDVQMDETG